ncbi:head GIN domain-containing protein [Aquimarina gracilis]|uniref:Head GIN domain-containing protein n=1 Tax=Aquimarina gracilis TaxID=874422 RepID=A0ABU6A231_9FLAO|nr:head GIN domain-containing protein [Aquimarina gracilis]MEB3348218.1 head GIN domain-containing protein [Aquimarina gracilis]
MRTATIILSIALCTITSVNAQWWGSKKINGNGNVVTKNRSTSDYDQVKVKGNLDVALVSGSEGKIVIEGESNLIEHIRTEVDGDVLKVYVEKEYYLKPSRGKKLLVTVPFEDLSKVTLAGSGDVYSKDVIKATNFKTGISGSGDVKLKVDAQNTEGYVTGSGDLVLSGSSGTFECKVTGSGDLSAYDLNAKDVTASVTGSGDIQVTANTSIKARITGSGDIEYKGNPEMEDKKVSGSGDISKRQ